MISGRYNKPLIVGLYDKYSHNTRPISIIFFDRVAQEVVLKLNILYLIYTLTMASAANTSTATSSVNKSVIHVDLRKIEDGYVCDNQFIFNKLRYNNQRGKVNVWHLVVSLFKKVAPESSNTNEATTIPLPIIDTYYNNEYIPDAFATYGSIYGAEDGKMQESKITMVSFGKSLGCSNKTNVWTQALREAYSTYTTHKRTRQILPADSNAASLEALDASSSDKNALGVAQGNAQKVANNYNVDMDSNIKLISPMLLHIYAILKKPKRGAPYLVRERVTDVLNYTTQTIYLQPKIDDIRCIATVFGETIFLYSRGLQFIRGFNKIRAELDLLYKAYLGQQTASSPGATVSQLYLDGGLYSHTMKLQDIAKIVKTELVTHAQEDQLIFHIFDCFTDGDTRTFTDRYALIGQLFDKVGADNVPHIKMIQTKIVHSEKEILDKFLGYVDQGYEGAVVRVGTGLYKPGTSSSVRSNDVLKIKIRYDDEFKIVGYTCGVKGKDVGAIIWKLQTAEGKEFAAQPNMSLAERSALYQELQNSPDLFAREYEDKLMTVEYAGFSKDKIPLQPKALRLRIE
jgi:hypothetical protein